MKKYIPYIITLFLVFNLLPLISKDLGMFILILLIICPLTAFICGLIYGAKHGFSFWLPLICATAFIPAMFIYYNLSAWVYIPIYAAAELAGNGIGTLIHRKSKKETNNEK